MKIKHPTGNPQCSHQYPLRCSLNLTYLNANPWTCKATEKKMRTLPSFLIACCVFALANPSGANQADRLNRLIESRRSSRSSVRYDSVPIAAYSPVFVGPQDGLMEADKIAALPGQPQGVNFDQYSGYVTVDPKNGRALFYYLVESSQNSSSKPVVLWLNGGPGCSSFGNGAMTELGPFRVNSDGKTLTSHPYAWNEVANVIYLESPAGVGFSYSNTTSDYYKSGDQMTAADSYTFLINWLERFPQYKTRDFFITGESYAGHYIPQLAYTILQNNKVTNQTVINLKGIAIGNAFVDLVTTEAGRVDFYWNRALISDETYAVIRANCNFSGNAESSICGDAVTKAYSELGNFDNYNIYAPMCNESGPPTSGNGGIGMASYDPCSGDYVLSYLNKPDVQKALHVNVPNIDWESCSGLPWNDTPDSMLPTFKELINSGLYMWLYSGDIDSVIPVTDTRYFFKMLGLPIKTSWRPWYFNSEVGGYVEEYEGLTLVTVRAAGHMVPRNQPERALTMFSSFLQGKLPPSS